jgi:hypothetical protein
MAVSFAKIDAKQLGDAVERKRKIEENMNTMVEDKTRKKR